MSTCLAVVVALVAVLVPSAASEAATVSGTVVFDGPQAPPPTVDLTFYGYSFEYRTLAITGRQTAYRFDVADTAVNAADATFTSPVAPDAFWLQDAQDVAVRPQPGLTLLGAGSYLADTIVFKQGVRYALPITDRAGRPFRPPHGWRSRGGTTVLNDETRSVLAPGARTVEGLTRPGSLNLEIRLAYADGFGIRREITPRIDYDTRLASSQAGTTVTQPPATVDASPPQTRAVRLPGRGYALFVARDPQSSVDEDEPAAYVKVGRRWRALPETSIATVQEADPDSRYVPIGRTGFRVQPLRGGRHKVRLCVANGDGMMAGFSRCSTTTVGSAG